MFGLPQPNADRGTWQFRACTMNRHVSTVLGYLSAWLFVIDKYDVTTQRTLPSVQLWVSKSRRQCITFTFYGLEPSPGVDGEQYEPWDKLFSNLETTQCKLYLSLGESPNRFSFSLCSAGMSIHLSLPFRRSKFAAYSNFPFRCAVYSLCWLLLNFPASLYQESMRKTTVVVTVGVTFQKADNFVQAICRACLHFYPFRFCYFSLLIESGSRVLIGLGVIAPEVCRKQTHLL